MPKSPRILVPVAFTPFAEQVVHYACALARGMSAELSLLHVVPSPAPTERQAAARRALDELADWVTEMGVESVRPFVLAGDPLAEIVWMAQEGVRADVIVLGASSRTAWQRRFAKPLGAAVQQSVSCPVLMVSVPPEKIGSLPQLPGRRHPIRPHTQRPLPLESPADAAPTTDYAGISSRTVGTTALAAAGRKRRSAGERARCTCAG